MVGQTANLLWVLYGLNWASRVRGVFRRWKQPHLRGEGWFFDVAVEPGFYTGVGRSIERKYQVRMLAPIALEVVFWFTAIATGHVGWLFFAVIAMVPIIHLNHWYNVQAAEREARGYAMADAAKPAARVGLSLTPRRLRDFTNGWVEAVIWIGTAGAFAWLFRACVVREFAARQVLGLPVLYLYLQLGFLLAKQVIVKWRAPVPMAQAAEYLEARESMRRYYLWTCDYNRVLITVGICMFAVSLDFPAAWRGTLLKGWEWSWAAVCLWLVIWTEIKRKQVAEVGVKARPVRLPDLSGMADKASWPVCFEPQVPMLVVQGERGYSVNLANTAAYLALAYGVGMVGLVMVARR